MPKLIRIEDENGSGPYSCGGVNWGDDSPYDGPEHPTPLLDPVLSPSWRRLDYAADQFGGRRGDYHFGFQDEEQLRNWFYRDQWLQGMKDAGCKLTEWEVPEGAVLYGESQVVFRRDMSTKVSTRELI